MEIKNCELYQRAQTFQNLKQQENQLDKYPSNLSKALFHQRVNKFGKIIKSLPQVQFKQCPCCKLFTNKQQLKLFFSQSDLSYLGCGFTLHFQFLKMLLFILFFKILIVNIFNLTCNIRGNSCTQQIKIYNYKCNQAMFNKFSFINRIYNYNQFAFIQQILQSIYAFILILIIIVHKKKQFILRYQCDKEQLTQDDYSIFIQNLPIINQSNVNYTQSIKNFFQDLCKIIINNLKLKNNLNKTDQSFLKKLKDEKFYFFVVNVNLAYRTQQLFRLQQLHQYYLNKCKSKNVKHQDSSLQDNYISKINNAKVILSKKYSDTFQEQIFTITNFTGFAFVSFQFANFKSLIKNLFKKNRINFPQNSSNKIIVHSGPHPHDVFWQNMTITSDIRKCRMYIVTAIMIIVLMLSFGLIYYIRTLRPQVNYENGIIKDYSQILGLALIIFVINIIIEAIVIQLTKFQGNKTRTDYFISYIVKASLAEFINQSILYFFLFFIDEDLSSQSGLINNITIYFILNSILNILKTLISPTYIIYLIKRLWKTRSGRIRFITQRQLNSIFQYPPYEIQIAYTNFISQYLSTTFYSYLIPITDIIVLFEFLINYLILKVSKNYQYNLITRRSAKFSLNFQMPNKLYLFVIFSASLRNLTIIYFHYILINRLSFIHIASTISLLTISVMLGCFTLFKEQKFCRLLCQKENIEEQSYESASQQFDTVNQFNKTYQRQNPATRMWSKKLKLFQKTNKQQNKKNIKIKYFKKGK